MKKIPLQKKKKINKPVPKLPHSIEAKYDRWLKQMMRDLHKETKKLLPSILYNFKIQKEKISTGKEDDISDIFKSLNELKRRFFKKYDEKKIKKQAQDVFNDTAEFNRIEQSRLICSKTQQTMKDVCEKIILSNTSRSLQSQKQVFVENNVSLIKSIAQKYFEEIIQDINRITAQQGRASELSQLIQHRYDLSKTKSDLIARDQIGKLNGDLARQRQQDAGIDLYEWSDSDDARVRAKHSVMDGKICKWSDPSVYADSVDDALNGNWKSRSSIDGVELHPGQDFRCRCVAIPVIV